MAPLLFPAHIERKASASKDRERETFFQKKLKVEKVAPQRLIRWQNDDLEKNRFDGRTTSLHGSFSVKKYFSLVYCSGKEQFWKSCRPGDSLTIWQLR